MAVSGKQIEMSCYNTFILFVAAWMFVFIGNPCTVLAQLYRQPARIPLQPFQPNPSPSLQLSRPAPNVLPNMRSGSAANASENAGRISSETDSLNIPNRNSRSPSNALASLSRPDSLQRLMPQMFADSPAAPLSVVINDGLIATTDLPLAGGARRMKVASNNRALPQDRVILQFQDFVNAYTADASQFIVGPASRTIDLNLYTLGFEKTFLDGNASLDVRMPFANQLELATPNFGVEGGTIGNLNAKLKLALISEQNYCFSVGSGFEVPTGSSVSFQGNGIPYIVNNDAFFIQPFLAYEERLNTWFFNAFASTDIAMNGNRFRVDLIGQPVLGRINDQILGVASVGGGKWLFFDSESKRLHGFALLSELHYTTTLQDSDAVSDLFIFQLATVSNVANRSDHLNLTIGGHLALGLTSLRFGYVQPLRNGDDQLFDHEFNVQFNRLF